MSQRVYSLVFLSFAYYYDGCYADYRKDDYGEGEQWRERAVLWSCLKHYRNLMRAKVGHVPNVKVVGVFCVSLVCAWFSVDVNLGGYAVLYCTFGNCDV